MGVLTIIAVGLTALVLSVQIEQLQKELLKMHTKVEQLETNFPPLHETLNRINYKLSTETINLK